MKEHETMTVEDLYSKVNDGIIKSDIDVQREIVYDDDKQRLVIDSLVIGVPLPAFYFWKNTKGTLETLDGKQRINAITRFMQNDLEYNGKIWMITDDDIKKRIKETELSCIICSGDESLKHEIFNRINTLGVPLSPFEVLNGLFNGEYLRGLTKYVQQDKGAIKTLGDAARGRRQMRALSYLLQINKIKPTKESINKWVKERKDLSFANDQKVLDKHIDFCAEIFDDMSLMNIFFELSLKYIKDKPLWKSHSKEINKAIKDYKKSDDWKLTTSKSADIEAFIKGILNNRTLDPRRLFTASQKEELLSAAEKDASGKVKCAICGDWFFDYELTVDHVKAWSKGGRTELSNAQLLCRPCNIAKSNSTSETE